MFPRALCEANFGAQRRPQIYIDSAVQAASLFYYVATSVVRPTVECLLHRGLGDPPDQPEFLYHDE